MKLKKPDLLLLSALAAGGLLLGSALALGRSEGAVVVVRVSGDTVAEFSQNRDAVYRIEGANGAENTLVIEDGQVWLEDASCPDRLCVRQGCIRHAGESILCLPNEVAVQIEGEADGSAGLDVVAS